MKVKVKQLYSNSNQKDKVLVADGNSGITLKYPQLHKGIIFPTDAFSGDTFYHETDNMIYYFDSVRSKWLSVDTSSYLLARNTLAANTAGYLGVADMYHSSTNGILLPKNGTIISVSLLNNNTITRQIQVRLNNSSTNIVDISLTTQTTRIINNANLDFNAGDFLNVYVNTSTGNILSGANCLIQVAWRH